MPFYCIYMSYSTGYKCLLKILTFAVGSEQNAANKNSVSADSVAFAGKICKYLSKFVEFSFKQHFTSTLL